MSLLERIESLYLHRGRQVCDEVGGVAFSVLEHALQTAQLADWDGAGEAMITAAFLHDIGRLLPLPAGADRLDDVHELRAVSYLAEGFGREVVEPIRLHVQAKRYLVARDHCYAHTLSAGAARDLVWQGGPMSAFEVGLFETLPFAREAIQLRLYDDRAKIPGRKTPPLAYYMALFEDNERRREAGRSPVCALSVA